VIGSRLGAAFSAGFGVLLSQPLQRTGFLKTPMPSLFHLELPLVEAINTTDRDRRSLYRRWPV
jgi:hypothetical protein